MDNYSGIYLAFCIPEAKICPKAAESSGCLCFHSDRFLDTTSLRRILTKLRLKKDNKKKTPPAPTDSSKVFGHISG